MASSTTKKREKDRSQGPQQSILSKSAQGASFLILIQVGSRALTFGVNQILLRFLSPALLGVSTQLEIYQISVLYFARESLRVAVQRQTTVSESRHDSVESTSTEKESRVPKGYIDADTPGGQTQTVVNISYIPIYLGVPIAFLLGALYIKNAGVEVASVQWVSESLHLYGVAAFWELLTEPCFVVVQQRLLYKIRALAETTATVVRCVITTGIVIWTAQKGLDLGVLPFALGQMAYALVLFTVYYWSVWDVSKCGGFTLSTNPIFSSTPSQYVLNIWSKPLLSLGGSLFLQSSIKHLLTQGDSILIAALSNLQDQGVYALASNYGGLIARMLFQPIEETSRTLFSTLLSSSGPKTASQTNSARANISTAVKILSAILRLYVLFSLIAASIGPTLAPQLLNLVAGSRWASSGAGEVLATYCYYIPTLAINGVSEAFISSVATSSELHTQSIWMFAFSLGFASAGYIFLRVLRWGAQGLVWANVFNMSLRILWSAAFIQRYLRRQGTALDIRQLVPSQSTLAAGAAAAAALKAAKHNLFIGGLWDLVISTAIAGPAVLIMIYFERDFLVESYGMLRSKDSVEAKKTK